MKSEFNDSVQIHEPMMNCELKTLIAPPIPLPQRKRTETKKRKKSMWMGSLSHVPTNELPS
jgi:hypothetical protein